ncbi:MAG: hypothetical protein H6Q19_1472 [Bacteroidetes bacterium]|nr:hypothetical protein [Bacteroidota bacterium]
MKKKFGLFIFCFLITLTSFGQQQYTYQTDTKYGQDSEGLKNEIHFNLLTSVLGLPEINYERIMESNFSVGMSLMASLDPFEKQNLRAAFLPFGRLYFSNDYAAGFYIEANGGLIIEKSRLYYYDYYSPYSGVTQSTPTVNTNSNFGLGVAIGYKFLTKNNWVGDIFAGAGRVFGDSNIDAYPRVGITIGKRF